MTLREMTKFDLKMMFEKVNAWRSRVLTISSTEDLDQRCKVINNFGEELEEVARILKECKVEDLK